MLLRCLKINHCLERTSLLKLLFWDLQTYQTRTGAKKKSAIITLLFLVFHSPEAAFLSNTACGTTTSRNRQSSVSVAPGLGISPAVIFGILLYAVWSVAIGTPARNSSASVNHAGPAWEQVVKTDPVLTVRFLPLGATGGWNRRLPTGGSAYLMLEKL